MSFNEQWANAPADMEERVPDKPPEPGLYEIAVTDFKAFISKKGNEVLIVEVRVTGGPLEGHEWPIIGGFASEGQAAAAKSLCARLGVDVARVTSLDQLDAEGKAFIGAYYSVEVVDNGEWRNTYLRERLGQPVVTDAPVGEGEFAPATQYEDTPF